LKVQPFNKILVVDDTPDTLILLSEILTTAGYSVQVAQSGELALQYLEKEIPSLILLDIMMPDMDGFEVCRKIKSSEEFGNIPVIFISALDDNESKINGFKAGGVDYISKPIHRQEVLARVNAHVNLYSLQQKLQEKNEALEREIDNGKQQKEALEKSVQLFQGLFNVSPDAIILIDPHDRNISWPIVDCNIAACNMNGYTHDELIGKSIDILNAEIQTKQDHDNYFSNLKKKGSRFIETVHRHKQGHVFPIEVLTSIITIGDREYILGIDRDITEKKKAEEELKIFKMGINNAEDAIFVTDTDGIIKFVNPAFEKVYGYTINEVIGRTPRILKSGLLKQADYKEFWDTLLSKKIISGEIINKRKDGSFVTIEGSNTPILDDAGNIIGFLSIHKDITDKKKAEIELVLAKYKAEESDRLKSAFLANMSHEIRTPLNCILGFSELLSDTSIDNEQRKEFSDLIETSANNLLAIINDIIDISKIEAGQVEVHNAIFSPQKLLHTVWKEFEHKAIEKGLHFSYSCDLPNEELMIESDENKLKQVLVNFIGNAIKFTEEGSIEIGIRENAEEIQFFVKDTGIGIPLEFRSHIFERFRQAETARTRKYGGNGLGLAISKNLTEILGGTIGIDSEPGKGSTFYIYLPKKPIPSEK
jgi:PAS domain S-box-containing protein